jgi:HK97 family phage portal protein
MGALFENQFGELFSGANIRRALGLPSRNNRHISQPDFTHMPLNFDRNEEWVSIDGREREIYLTTPELKIVIDRLATMFANGVWRHYDKNGIEIENSEHVARLENPNIQQSRNEFLTQWFIERCLYPGTFTYMLRPSELVEVPLALWNLPPSRIVVNRTGKIWNMTELEEIVSSYELRYEKGKNETFKTKDIIQFNMPDPDDPILGRSTLDALKMPISNIRAAYGYRNVILTKKGAIGMWSTDGKDAIGSINLTPEEEKKMSEELTRTYGIGDHQAKIMISSKPMKWTAATYPTKDLMLFEEVDANKKAIIDMFGANEYMFASGVNAKGSTFTNVEMGNKICYQDTIIPIAEDYANGFTKRFGLNEKGEYLCLEYDHLPVLQDNEKEEAETNKLNAETAGILLVNGYTPESINAHLEWDVEGGVKPEVNGPAKD